MRFVRTGRQFRNCPAARRNRVPGRQSNQPPGFHPPHLIPSSVCIRVHLWRKSFSVLAAAKPCTRFASNIGHRCTPIHTDQIRERLYTPLNHAGQSDPKRRIGGVSSVPIDDSGIVPWPVGIEYQAGDRTTALIPSASRYFFICVHPCASVAKIFFGPRRRKAS